MTAAGTQRTVRRPITLVAGCALALTLISCGSGGDAVVTMTTQVAAGPPASSAAGPTSTPRPTTKPVTLSKSSTSSMRTSSPASATSKSTASSTAKPTANSTASSSGKSTEKSSKGSGGGSSLLPADQIPTENAAQQSPDTPGPETGPKCATNADYVDEQPTGLRSDVITAWRNVEKYANADGIIVCLNDGKRSTAQQQAQYDEYLEQYGKQAADQLVLKPDKSAHVTGNAIDVQPAAAYQWLQATKGALGLCRTYDNEGWHFEYDASYFRGCPPRQPKPAH